MANFRRRSSRLSSSAALAALSLVALAACSPDPSPEGGEPPSASDAVIRTVLASDPSSFDPALAAGQQTFQINSLLYDTLLRRGGATELVGGLAESWEVVSASEYTFTIRDDATCADGTPITAGVVADSLEYLASPETNSTWRNLVFGLGDATVVAEEDTVSIALSEPFTTLLEGLTIPQTGIICPAGLADLEGLAAGTVEGGFSGPYVLAQADAGIGYSFALREDYAAWPLYETSLPGAPAGTIDVTISTDQSSVANQLIAGDLEFAQFQDVDTIARLEANPDFTVETVTQATTYVVFNQRPGRVFADDEGGQALRQGVAQAIDQNAFNTVFSGGTSEVLTTVVPSSFQCASTDASLLEVNDPDAAAAVLAGAGPIKILGNTANAQYSGGADYIYQVLTDAGANVEIEKVDNATFWSTIPLADADWDLVFLGDLNSVGAISASLDRVIGPATEDGGRNYSASVNPEGEATLAEALGAADETARCEAFMAAQQSLFDRDDVVPLVGNNQAWAMGPATSVSIFGDIVDFATLRVVD